MASWVAAVSGRAESDNLGAFAALTLSAAYAKEID
jgi:hypothetical protein